MMMYRVWNQYLICGFTFSRPWLYPISVIELPSISFSFTIINCIHSFLYMQHLGWSEIERKRKNFSRSIPNQGLYVLSCLFRLLHAYLFFFLALQIMWDSLKFISTCQGWECLLLLDVCLRLKILMLSISEIACTNSHKYMRYWHYYCSKLSFHFMLCILTKMCFISQLSLLLKGTVVAPPDKFGT